jgi:autotransporter-associated beta strand protein
MDGGNNIWAGPVIIAVDQTRIGTEDNASDYAVQASTNHSAWGNLFTPHSPAIPSFGAMRSALFPNALLPDPVRALNSHMSSIFIQVSRVGAVLGLLLAGSALRLHGAPPAGYYLVWADEFTGSSLDTSKWNYWLAGPRRDAINTSSAVSVSGGNLTITTYTTNGTHYTGIIATDNKFRTKFGYWEASIDWNDAPGMWSAYWMQSPTMGANVSDPVTSGCEIDIAEHRSIDSGGTDISGKVQANIHWNGYSASHVSQGSGNVGSGLNAGFHTYGCKWTSGAYDFTIDGATKWTGGSSPVSRSTEWMILSSEVDDASWAGSIPVGGYGNLGTSTTKMIVDYVRYYAPTSTVFWTGTGSAFWTNSANWISNKVPVANSDVTFSYVSTANCSNVLGANFSVDSLTVLETTAAFSVNGPHTLTLGAGGVDMISLAQNAVFNCPVAMGASQTWTIGGSRTLTLNNTLSGTGALTKSGTGTLVVGVSNTIGKSIFVTNGAVALGAGSSNSVAYTAASNGALQALVGASPARCATLNLTNANLNFSFGTVTGIPGVGIVAPTLNVVGTVDVNVTGLNLPVTNITLLTYTAKAGGGTFQMGTLPAGAEATLTDTGSALVLNVTVWPQVLTWSGTVNGTWNTNGSLNWESIIGAVAYQEYASSADAVVFDDSSVTSTVTLAHALRPASITVANDEAAYTFNSPGRITGTTGLVKTGTNTLTLNTSNTFSGNLTISDGKVAIGSGSGVYQKTAGTKITVSKGGTLTVPGNLGYDRGVFGYLAAQATGLVLDGGTLQHTGAGNSKNSDGAGRLFTIGANGATLNSATAGQTFSIGYRYDYGTALTSSSGGSLELAGPGLGDLNYTFPGGGSLLKSGSGTWSLTVANSFTGPTTVEAGVLNLQNSGALGGTADGTIVEANARLELQGGITITGEPLTISGTGGTNFFNGALHSKSGSNTWTGPVTLDANNTRIGAEAGATLVISGAIGDNGATNNLVARSTDSTGMVIVSGASSYLGSTWLVAGNLKLDGGNNRLPMGTTLVLGGSGIVVFNLNGRSQEVAGITTNGSNGSIITNGSASLATLTLNTPAGSPTTYTGRLMGNVALTKSGPDAFRLTGASAHTGNTLIQGGALVVNGSLGSSVVSVTNSGALSGTGAVSGPVTIQNGGTLAPGDFTIGRLTISNSLTLLSDGVVQMELNKATPTNDSVFATGTINYGGTLSVTNLSGSLAPGDAFKLFDAAAFAGNFDATNLPSLPSGLGWQFTATNGTLSVVATIAVNPTNLTFSVSGGNLTLGWPSHYVGWLLQTQTNSRDVGLKLNWFDVPGSELTNSVTFPINPVDPTVFFRLTQTNQL